MKKINLGQKDLIHFIGIGGIGMSGLAQIMKNMGFRIQGRKKKKNKNTITCTKLGIKVFIGHAPSNIKKATILVKSTAIKNNNPEIKYAKKNKIPIYSRAEVLADVVSQKKNIIITGSHGKTTTTFFPVPNSFATLFAAKHAAPEELPAISPSSFPSLLANKKASSSETGIIRSSKLKFRTFGLNPAPIP